MQDKTHEVRMLMPGEIETLSEMTARRFLTDPLSACLLTGVEGKKEYLEIVASTRIEQYRIQGEVLVRDVLRGLLAGHYASNEDRTLTRRMERLIADRAYLKLDAADIEKIASNGRRLGNLGHTRWQRRTCRGGYYCIDLVCVAEELKGTGALRALMTPVITAAEKENLPIVLFTHSPKNLEIYAHFSFEIIKEYPAKHALPVTQYCLIRRP